MIPADEARIDYVLLDKIDDQAALQRALGWLTDDERRRYDRFHFEHSKREFLVARWLIRDVLGGLMNTNPEAIHLSIDAQGKPSLPDHAIEFNLSHTRGAVGCAFTLRHPVGLDVEAKDARRAQSGIAERYFSAQEFEDLSAFEGSDYTDYFFQLWTLKEAYIKAHGKGLSLPLNEFHFLFNESPPVISIGFAPALKDDPLCWQFHYWEPTAGHAMAVAIRRGSAPDLTLKIEERLFLP